MAGQHRLLDTEVRPVTAVATRLQYIPHPGFRLGQECRTSTNAANSSDCFHSILTARRVLQECCVNATDRQVGLQLFCGFAGSGAAQWTAAVRYDGWTVRRTVVRAADKEAAAAVLTSQDNPLGPHTRGKLTMYNLLCNRWYSGRRSNPL